MSYVSKSLWKIVIEEWKPFYSQKSCWLKYIPYTNVLVGGRSVCLRTQCNMKNLSLLYFQCIQCIFAIPSTVRIELEHRILNTASLGQSNQCLEAGHSLLWRRHKSLSIALWRRETHAYLLKLGNRWKQITLLVKSITWSDNCYIHTGILSVSTFAFYNLFIWLCWVLVVTFGVFSHSMQNPLTRDRTQDP